MSEQENDDRGNLVPAGRRDLAPFAAANPLVSRGLADLAQVRLLKLTKPSPLDRNNALFYYNRGVARLEPGDDDNAMRDFDEAICLDPQNALYHNTRGLAWLGWSHQDALSYIWNGLLDETEFDKALRDFDEAIRLDPQNAFFFNSRGRAWLDKAHDENFQAVQTTHTETFIKAITDFDQAIRLDPQNAHVYFNRANAWLGFDEAINRLWDDGSYHKVIEHKRAIRFDPNCAYDKAIKDIDQAILDEDYDKASNLMKGIQPHANEEAIKDFT